ncbi:unnamed protein product, partial [Dovyalis caffra]
MPHSSTPSSEPLIHTTAPHAGPLSLAPLVKPNRTPQPPHVEPLACTPLGRTVSHSRCMLVPLTTSHN